MPCTTILVGKAASHDHSTMIARTDDGSFDVKKLIVVTPDKQPKKYKSVLSHLSIDLPADPLRYTACPNVDRKDGIWAATGINEKNVGMTATETITSNPRVLAADPLVVYDRDAPANTKPAPGGIGEEDILTLVLPYIRSAREGVTRLGQLLETYGTYESNGVAFNDRDEVWWMETIGGHHWMARRLPDDMCAILPNRFALNAFDLEDALGEGKDHLCSKDLKAFIADNCLDLNGDGAFDPRQVFGSATDMDHIYNTPRSWFMGRYLCPKSLKWDGPDADYGPESDDIPWALKPERLLTPEDVKYLLSAHYQGTAFDPYAGKDTGARGRYRSIGINRTGVTAVCQIRGDMPAVEWVCFGSTTFSAALPLYANVPDMPRYLKKVTADVDTGTFYWASRLIGALADPHYAAQIQSIWRYQEAVTVEGRKIIREYDKKYLADPDPALLTQANEALAAMAEKQTGKALRQVLATASVKMKNGYNLADH